MSSGSIPQELVALEYEEEGAAAEALLDAHANRGPREKDDRPRKFLERSVAICDPQAGHIVDGPVLQIEAASAIGNHVAEGDILWAIQPLEDQVDERSGQCVGQDPIGFHGDPEKIGPDTDPVGQCAGRKEAKRDLCEIDGWRCGLVEGWVPGDLLPTFKVLAPLRHLESGVFQQLSQGGRADLGSALPLDGDAAFLWAQTVTEGSGHEPSFDVHGHLVLHAVPGLATQGEGRHVVERNHASGGIADGFCRAGRRAAKRSDEGLGTARGQFLVAVKHDEQGALDLLRLLDHLEAYRRAWQERDRMGEQSERALAVAFPQGRKIVDWLVLEFTAAAA